MIAFPLSTIRLDKGNLIKLFSCQSLHKINRVVIMKLFHGTYEKVAPIIKIGEFAMSGNNVFDGLFASPERDIAASHGNTVFIYHVDDDKIAKSRDLDAHFQEVYAFLHNELDTADVEEIADHVMWDNNSDIEDFADILSPRLGSDIRGAYSW
ncbi:hypothetical protein EC12741_B0102 [Escherichia coli 1.2741]|nr:hypothetical protein EC12741_B0102 [Escherichia coli 1.2741]